MFFEFPDNPKAYDDIARNIMLGSAIKFSPNIFSNATSGPQDFYFPAGTWCNLFDNECFNQETDGDVSLNANTDVLNLHLREGNIIQFTDAIGNEDLSVYELFDDWTNVKILLDADNQAQDSFFFDDGLQVPNDLAGTYSVVITDTRAEFNPATTVLTFTSSVDYKNNSDNLSLTIPLTINKIELLNANAINLDKLIVKTCTYDDTVTIAADCLADAKYDGLASSTGLFSVYFQTPLRWANVITVTIEFEESP